MSDGERTWSNSMASTFSISLKGSRWRRPAWTYPFVEEPMHRDPEEASAELPPPYASMFMLGCSLVGFATQLVTVFYLRSPPLLASAIVFTILLALVALILAICRPRTSPIAITILLAAICCSQIVLVVSEWTSNYSSLVPALWIVSAATSLSAVVVAVNMPLRHPLCPRDGISKPFTTPSNEVRTPEDSLTLWQWMTVSWMAPLISLGNQRQLHDEDVWLLGYEFQHRHLHDTFREMKGTVVRRLVRANWIDLALLTFLAILELAAKYSIPLLLQKLLQAMENLRVNKGPAITFAVLMMVLRLISAQSSVFSLWFGRRAYERSRGEMITMLYEKSLNRKIIGEVPNDQSTAVESESPMDRMEDDGQDIIADLEETEIDGLLNGHAKEHSGLTRYYQKLLIPFRFFSRLRLFGSSSVRQEEPASKGKIMNLMRNDVYEVAQRFWEFQLLLNKPIGLMLSLILVWQLIGWPCLFGVAVVIITQILNYALARILMSWEKTRRAATDTKLQKIANYVEAIRHLRWYGWHPTWLADIKDARQKELNLKVITYVWNNFIKFFNQFGGGLLPVVSFWAYTILAGKELRIDVAFPALQLFTLLQADFREIPKLITVLLNASVAIGRIEAFMNEPDKDDSKMSSAGDTLELKNASFAWPGFSNNVLHDITLAFPVGINVIFGPVAAGKSALLQAILGELDITNGELIEPHEPIAYCTQTPWLQSMSIRDNILFHSPYDELRYKKILDACALTADLATFKHGDLSNIGENGIGLSGGQRARVALARAVYSPAKILLLDDPLSALDQQTAESIVAKLFNGPLMQNRTVLLVTHRTDLTRESARQLIEVKNGAAHVVSRVLIQDIPSSPVSKNAASATGDTEPVDKAIEDAAVPEKFMEEEHRAHGGVQAAVYWEYIKAGKFRWWAFVILACVVFRLLMITNSWFLKTWGEAYNRDAESILTFQQFASSAGDIHIYANPLDNIVDRFPNPSVNAEPWILGYFTVTALIALTVLLLEFAMLLVTYSSAKQMFNNIMDRVSHTAFRFYDVTPVGRLMNRLTSDIGTIDGNISDLLLEVAWQGIAWVFSIVVIASVTPLFVVFSVALTAAFVFTFLRFLPTSQSLRRLEMVSLSPLLSNFGTLLDGLTTVRAFQAQHQFQSGVITVTDAFQKMDHFYWSLQAWLMYRFDILSSISTLILTLLAIYSGLSPGLTAFVLVSAQRFVLATHSLCKQYGQLQLDFVAVERVVELLRLEQEDPGQQEPPASWPSTNKNDIVFENVTIRYATHLDPALSNVSFTLKKGTNTAVVGRTGSGKSTLALALLSTIPIESGRILIGGLDISMVDKQALRTRITFLAQDPVLFPGTLRHNLDPTNAHSDEECLSVLSRCCGNYNWTLSTPIEAGGKNLSQGQRQLVGLARAVLRRSAVLIMDEATASIDLKTAAEIQRLLREEMKGSTVVTIAHRKEAVESVDGVVELRNGRVWKLDGIEIDDE